VRAAQNSRIISLSCVSSAINASVALGGGGGGEARGRAAAVALYGPFSGFDGASKNGLNGASKNIHSLPHARI